ncbi:hypothetical protein L9G74_21680, partial [Shewanella sp. C32]
ATITDTDGDVATDDASFTITDGGDPRFNPAQGGALSLDLDDDALNTGVTGNLSFTAGSDDITGFSFADPSVTGFVAPTVTG